tara:strand:+ start:50 stop:472 length:423 start_codon:yes stop_codon:yes gene_type:complete
MAFGLFPSFPKKKPFFGETFGSFNSPQPIRQVGGDASLAESLYKRPGFQPGGAPSGGQHQGFPDMTKDGGGTNQTKEMLEALSELTFDNPTPSNLGKPGGTGGGGFKLLPNSMVENRTPIGPFDEDEQRKRWWAMYGKIA